MDPIEGGSANDYDYAEADPINQFDLTGTHCSGKKYNAGKHDHSYCKAWRGMRGLPEQDQMLRVIARCAPRGSRKLLYEFSGAPPMNAIRRLIGSMMKIFQRNRAEHPVLHGLGVVFGIILMGTSLGGLMEADYGFASNDGCNVP